MLSIYEYITLDTAQRAEILWDKGEFISNTVIEDCGFALYSLYGFYVEVVLVQTELSEVTPFKQGERLEKYLACIDITELKGF